VTGTINEPAKSIAINMPYGTEVTALKAMYTANVTKVSVGSTLQTSSETSNDFTLPVTYTLTTTNGSTKAYQVVVTLSSTFAKAITSFSFNGYSGAAGVVNETDKTIAVTLPYATVITDLVATFNSTGASVMVGTEVQTSGVAPGNDFTLPVAYIVSAADGASATYTVTVSLALNFAKEMTSFSFNGYTGATGTVNETNKSITVTVPYATDLTNLVATFVTTGDSVMVGSAVQTSAVAPGNDFTSPVEYIVNAADGTTATYSVTVTVALNFAKEMTAFSFAGITDAVGTIDEAAKTIAVPVPFGTDVTALVSTFTTTGASVIVGNLVQTSNAAPGNDFSSPVDYLVTAADGTNATYTVTLTPALNPAKAITAFSFVGFPLEPVIIDEANKTIDLILPAGTDVTALVTKFSTTGVLVEVGVFQPQISEVTENDFSGVDPVYYLVTAADDSFVEYAVTVTLRNPLGPLAVDLGTAGNFAILAKTGVSATGTTLVTGDIGLSPAAATFVSGFDLIADASNEFSGSSLVVGNVYASNYAPPTPTYMTTAVSDMETAFTDAAGRTLPDFTELGAGNISGMTLEPGLYKWGTGVLITDVGVTISGASNDVWIFQVAEGLTVDNGAIVTLAGGAQAKNIFWQVGSQTTLGTTSDFKGNILGKTLIAFNTGAVLNGRALSQTEVTLDATTITVPAQ
jgi:hypothetical protein